MIRSELRRKDAISNGAAAFWVTAGIVVFMTGTSFGWSGPQVTASSNAAESSPRGAMDGDRFATTPASVWRAAADQRPWWWQVAFDKPRRVGAILQIHGDKPLSLGNAPTQYVWQYSHDGHNWQNWSETAIHRELRMFRIHRLKQAEEVRFIRLNIDRCTGPAPVLREIEFYEDPQAAIEFPDWVVVISTDDSHAPPESPGLFANLIRECPDWKHSQIQQVRHEDVDEAWIAAEPRPLCALLTGSSKDWCQVNREGWRGFQQVLKNRHLPIWGACGGAQILAILEETGVDQPWDCPRCRDPMAPKLPIYTHISHTDGVRCGDFSKSLGERGEYLVRRVAHDPVFENLPELFETMQAHYGQIAYVPKGWVRVVTKGPQGLTENQCLRVADRFIYAAQFHIELPGTPEPSRRIMSNFLKVAKQWGGYNPQGLPVPPPTPFTDAATAPSAGPAISTKTD